MLCRPFRACVVSGRIDPRVIPWAVIVSPFRAKRMRRASGEAKNPYLENLTQLRNFYRGRRQCHAPGCGGTYMFMCVSAEKTLSQAIDSSFLDDLLPVMRQK